MPNIFPPIQGYSPSALVPNDAQQALLGTVGAPSRSSLALNGADNALQAAQDQLAADSPKKYDYSAHSVLGNVGHVLGRFGNIAGDILNPAATALIPGSDLNNAAKQGGDRKQVQQATENQQAAQRESDTVNNEQANRDQRASEFDAEAPVRDANTLKAQQETAASIAQNKPLDDIQARTLNAAWGTHLFAPGMTPQEVARLAQAHEKVNEMQQKAREFQAKLAETQQAHKDHEQDVAEGRADRMALAGNKQDTQAKQATFKAYQPSMDSAERVNVMTQNYEDAVKNHDQQAMLSLLANHLGMTMGLQKGARITKDTYQEAAKSQPWLQGVGAHFDSNGYLSGVALSVPQMQQMVGLAHDRFREDVGKSRNEAKYLGATDDGPERTPSKSTINYYMAQAGGDVAKAKQLAAEGGWSIK